MKILTILPRREGYAASQAGAIALLVSRLAQPNDVVVGTAVEGNPLPGGTFVAVEEPGGLWRWRRGGTRYRRACQTVINRVNPELIEVHNRPALAMALAKGNIPVNLILHSDPRGLLGARRPIQRHALLEKVRVFGVSQWIKARFMEDIDEGPVGVLPNCLDLSALPARPPQKAPIILYVGRVVADKGVDAFVRAWSNIAKEAPKWHAVMIGADRFAFNSPRTAFIERVERDAQACGITLCGYQMHAQVLEAMALASIVVVPSRWEEPFGLTALEAMASGAALIVSPRGGLPEVVGDAAFLASPDAAGELENVMLRLIKDASLREDFMARGLERAKRFDVTEARKLLQHERRLSIDAGKVSKKAQARHQLFI